MSRGYTVDRRQVAFDRFQKFAEHNPTAPTRRLTLIEQETLAKNNMAKQKLLAQKRQQEKETEDRIILDSPYSTPKSRKINQQLYGT